MQTPVKTYTHKHTHSDICNTTLAIAIQVLHIQYMYSVCVATCCTLLLVALPPLSSDDAPMYLKLSMLITSMIGLTTTLRSCAKHNELANDDVTHD